MTLDEYQQGTRRTVNETGDDIAVLALGLAGEAGEVCDIVKKHKGQGHPFKVISTAVELGDILWYVARMADKLGMKLSDVASLNVDKLSRRYPNGFEVQRSMEREESGPP